MVKVAPGGGHRAGRVVADATPESDGSAELSGWKATHLCHIEQISQLIG